MSAPQPPSVISSDLRVHGTIHSSGIVQINGHIEGGVRAKNVVVGEGAFVDGEVVADDLTVLGRVRGTIRARKCSLSASCNVEGTLLHAMLTVQSGAGIDAAFRKIPGATATVAAAEQAAVPLQDERRLVTDGAPAFT